MCSVLDTEQFVILYGDGRPTHREIHSRIQTVYSNFQGDKKLNFGSFFRLFHTKVKQSHYRSELLRGFQEVKVPRLRDNGPGRW